MKLILHKALLNPQIVDVSKPVLQEIYNSNEWQQQVLCLGKDSDSDSSRSSSSTNGSHINSVTAKRFMENLRQIIQLVIHKKGKKPMIKKDF